MRKDVRILLVGDENVGKSSLITSLITESFALNVPDVIPEVTIPPEVTPEKVTTYIIDSSSRSDQRQTLEQEIRKAHVICIVHAVDDQKTFQRISSYWLPYIKQLGVNVPIVLVGNKIDVRGEDIRNSRLEDEILPIMDEFKEVETGVECSAKTLMNISELFYFAQKAVLHPTAPLYDSREYELKPACVDALKRIFKLCDSNKDGFLDDFELNEFQRKCFKIPLQQQELEGVKEVVREQEPDGVSSNGLTEAGFLFLHRLFIQRGRVETTWAVLRNFGYGDDLYLSQEFLFPIIEVPSDSSVELSPKGIEFFAELFSKYDMDKDGALKSEELQDLFSTSPGNPWAFAGFPDCTLTNEEGYVTLQGFLGQWSMTTLLDYTITLSYLAYLGYTGESITAIKVTRSRKIDRKRQTVTRNVFLCYVFGATGSGKSAILRHFVNKPFLEGYQKNSVTQYAINSVEVSGSEKHLVMLEYGLSRDHEILKNKKIMEACDLALFVYDSSDVNSFEYVANLRNEFDFSDYPSLIVATKSDLDLVPQRYELQPDIYCRQNKLPIPRSVSIKTGFTADLYSYLVSVALEP